jgi:signal transduction histidine kinase
MNINKVFSRLPIRMKLTIAFALLSLFPLAIMGVYGLWITSDSLERITISQVKHSIELVKVKVDNLLRQTQEDLDYLEQLEGFGEFVRLNADEGDVLVDNTLVSAIELFCASYPVYFQIRYLDLNGDERLRVVDQGGAYGALPARGNFQSGAGFYRHVASHVAPRSSMAVPVELLHPLIPGRLIPALSFIRLSCDPAGQSQGMWVADLYADRLIELLKRPPIALGGELVLCDAQGHYLYHPAKKKEWRQLLATQAADNLFEDWPPDVARAILSDKEGFITRSGNEIIAHTAVWRDPSDPSKRYVLYYHAPADVAFAPARRLAWVFLILGILTMSLVVVASYLGAGQLSRPLMALSNGARIISGGSFNHRIKVTTNDEIETVADDFNRMAEAMAVRDKLISGQEAKLKQYAEGLEEMVEERTGELKKSQQLLARSEKMAAIGRLAAGIAHEVNNPVSIILNRIEATIQEHKEKADKHLLDDLAVMSSHAQRIAAITENLLRFARPRTLERTDVNLLEACDSVVKLIGPEFDRRGVSLNVRRPKEPVIVQGDQNRMEQVILNLLDNALDASLKGQTVTLEVNGLDKTALIRVEDTGIGISSECLDQIFDPFFTTKGVGQGSGLGLTITDELVRDHGGIIKVNSVEGEGTEFIIEIPL